MSILIKGMEMPRSCEYCNLCSDDGYCLAMGGESLWDVLPEDADCFPDDWKYDGCPLVPVPKRGRLIDADELRSTMYHEAFETDSQMQKWDSGCWIRYKMFEQQLDSAPTIIEAEVNKQ